MDARERQTASAEYDYMGKDVSGVGDVNGDGIPDVIVGAFKNDDCSAGSTCGAAYIIFGSETLSGTRNSSAATAPDVTFLGKAGSDYLGRGIGGGRSSPGP